MVLKKQRCAFLQAESAFFFFCYSSTAANVQREYKQIWQLSVVQQVKPICCILQVKTSTCGFHRWKPQLFWKTLVRTKRYFKEKQKLLSLSEVNPKPLLFGLTVRPHLSTEQRPLLTYSTWLNVAGVLLLSCPFFHFIYYADTRKYRLWFRMSEYMLEKPMSKKRATKRQSHYK